MASTSFLPGARWRATHQASIDAVLGAGVRTVTSRGAAFANRDNWTARKFIAVLCEWAAMNPTSAPTGGDVEAWVYQANHTGWVDSPGIMIAETPDDLTHATGMALVGGAYHEAWHTRYSRRTPLNAEEVKADVARLWPLVANWGPLTSALLTWSNIVEDIRIERVGNAEYPGAKARLEALQDLILDQEAAGLARAIDARANVNDDLHVVICAFRDLGLGYRTPKQRAALMLYRDRSPTTYALVESGDLRPFLDAAIALGRNDDLGCVWLAMAVLARIVQSAQQERPKPQPSPKSKSQGDKGQDSDESDESDESDDSDDSDDSDESDESDDSDDSDDNRQPTYKVGDRARLTSGPLAGREVEVTAAGQPDANGVQQLEFALVEAD